jgi:hypothetical protein
MYCGGSHPGSLIGITNIQFVEDLPMITPGHFGFNCPSRFKVSETTNIIKANLYMNVHWMVLYKFYVSCSDMKFKMAATAGLSLTLDPMGNMFQNASSLKPLGQLKPNCPGIVIGRSSTKFMFFHADRKFKMSATAGHSLTLDPMGKYSNAFFSETTNMIEAKVYMNVH